MVASKSASAQKKVPAKARVVAKPYSEDIGLPLPKDISRTRSRVQPIGLRKSTPMWLLSLYALQRPSSAVMFLLVAIMMSVYSWTVYSQKMWSHSYRNLATLQRHERQLTTASEVLKNKLALQAEQPITNLITPNPTEAIFLQQAQERPSPVATVLPISKAGRKTNQPNPIPLGY